MAYGPTRRQTPDDPKAAGRPSSMNLAPPASPERIETLRRLLDRLTSEDLSLAESGTLNAGIRSLLDMGRDASQPEDCPAEISMASSPSWR
jgi:hypothetical protein